MGASVRHCVDFPIFQSQNNPHSLAQNAIPPANSHSMSFGTAFRHQNRKRQRSIVNQDYFRGCMSLPYFFVSFDNLDDFMNE
jgi:hypothetical protein